MKFSVNVHHTISIADETKEFIKSLFPATKEIQDITKDVKEQTEKLKEAVDTNTP